MMIWLFGVVVFVVTIWITRAADKRKSPEQKQKEEEQLQREREAIAEAWNAHKNQRNIVEVKYLGTGEATRKRCGLGGFLLGGFFGGPIGAIVGAMIPENVEPLQRFAVNYADGRVAIKDLHPNDCEYKKLVKLVKWEEL